MIVRLSDLYWKFLLGAGVHDYGDKKTRESGQDAANVLLSTIRYHGLLTG